MRGNSSCIAKGIRPEHLASYTALKSELEMTTITFLVFCFVENLPKTLSEFHVSNSARLKADDFLQNYQLILNIIHRYVDKIKQFRILRVETKKNPV